MSIHSMLTEWLAGIRSDKQLDSVAQSLWQDFANGKFTEAEVDRLAAAIDERRKAIQSAREDGIPPPRSWFPVRPRSNRDRATAATGGRCPQRWARKRRLGAMEALPPSMREHFTEGERAVLYIIAADCRQNGSCHSWIQQIADRAGVGKTTVRNAIRQARNLGLLEDRHREQWRGKNLSNIVKIICRDWLSWLRKFRPRLGFNFQRKGVNLAMSSETFGKNNQNGQPKHSQTNGPTGGFQPFANRKPQPG